MAAGAHVGLMDALEAPGGAIAAASAAVQGGWSATARLLERRVCWGRVGGDLVEQRQPPLDGLDRPVAGVADEGQRPLYDHTHGLELLPAGDGVAPPLLDDPLGREGADPRHALQLLLWGVVHVQGEPLHLMSRDGELGVHRQVQEAAVVEGWAHLLLSEAVDPLEVPVAVELALAQVDVPVRLAGGAHHQLGGLAHWRRHTALG